MHRRRTAVPVLRSCALVAPVLLVAALVAPAAQASSAPGWDDTRLLSSTLAALGVDGRSVVAAEWAPTGTETGSPVALRLTVSRDEGGTFAVPASEPTRFERTGRVSSVHVDPASETTTVVSDVTDRASGAAGVRIDRYRADGAWLAPTSGPLSTSCPTGPTLAAVRGTTLVLANACAELWRSTDGGAAFTRAAGGGPATGSGFPVNSPAVVSLTPTADGFSLLHTAVSYDGWTRLLSTTSHDDGATFAAPQQVSPTVSEEVTGASAAYEASSGTLVAAVHVLEGKVGSPLRLEARRSADGGTTWSPPVVVDRGPSPATRYPVRPLVASTGAGLDLSAQTFPGDATTWVRWGSSDAGATWAVSGQPAPQPPPDAFPSRHHTAGGQRVHLLRGGFYDRTLTAVPAAAPSPSPTPEPAVRVTLTPQSVSAGQVVTVTYRGAPGSTVEVLSRTQPATTFTRIATVVLDARGVATSTHKPQRNTRITARTAAAGASPDAPLVLVRSVASLNARRVAPRTYVFTGRVYPALANRLVNLYRNGTLVAQGRCDSTGVYTISKTLAAGTYPFLVQTPNDGSNLGATSPTLRVAVQ